MVRRNGTRSCLWGDVIKGPRACRTRTLHTSKHVLLTDRLADRTRNRAETHYCSGCVTQISQIISFGLVLPEGARRATVILKEGKERSNAPAVCNCYHAIPTIATFDDKTLNPQTRTSTKNLNGYTTSPTTTLHPTVHERESARRYRDHYLPTMTSVTSGFGVANGNGSGNAGTEFLSMLAPPRNDLSEYDNTKPHTQQPASIPPNFLEAMSVREEVYGEQGIPLEAEFDEDDARSWHWVVYASVASTASSPPKSMRPEGSTTKEEDTRRASASASRVPVGTVRLIPPPHGPNKYVEDTTEGKTVDKHGDADPPPGEGAEAAPDRKHPVEPYIKLGRLAVLAPYRRLGLAKLLINTALDYAQKHPDVIYQPPSPTTLELANLRGHAAQESVTWQGLVMIHAQANLKNYWEKVFGFKEELVNEDGTVEIEKEPHWKEEGIEHVGMWKRLKIEIGRL